MSAKKIKQLVDFHKGFKIPFKMSVSNYTCLFKSKLDYIHFLKQAQNRKVFSAYNKLKANIQQLPKEVNMQFIKYYQTDFRINNFYADKIYQVDIKSCYANLLYNNHIIDKASIDYLYTLEKPERLAAVGMLASKKEIFEFDSKGNCFHSKQINPYSDYFFYCVQETFLIMNEAKEILGKNFLFSWVDAIYFTGGRTEADKIIKYFKDVWNLESSFAILNQFEVEMREDFYRLRYIKNDLPTFMNIPTQESQQKKDIVDFMLTYKYSGEKINKFKLKTNNNKQKKKELIKHLIENGHKEIEILKK